MDKDTYVAGQDSAFSHMMHARAIKKGSLITAVVGSADVSW